jgi:MFS family permease
VYEEFKDIMSQTYDDADTYIKKHRFLPWIVWGLGCLFYFYEFLLQVSPSVMGQTLMSDFSVTAHSLGFMAGVYFYSYAIMQIPGGIMMDRFGPHKLLTIATVVCALSSIAFGLTESFAMATFARFSIGFGSAFAAVGAMKLAANWFPPQRFALLTGIMVTIGMLGAIGGESPLALMINKIGWRHSMILLGIAGLFLALLILIVAKDSPMPAKKQKSKSKESVFQGLKNVINNRQLWLVAVYGGLMYMPTPVFCGLWGVPFLMHKYNYDHVQASALVSLIFVGWVIASPLWGAFSDRIRRRLVPMYIGTTGSLITFSAILYLPLPNVIHLEILLVLFGIFSSGFLTAFSIAKEISCKSYVATSLSFMNMMNMVGVALAQPFIGRVLDLLWSGTIKNNVRIYSIKDYSISISVLTVGIAIAAIILPFIKDTYCKPKD